MISKKESRVLFILVIMVITFPVALYSQIGFEVSPGIAIPISDLSTYWSSGPYFDAVVLYSLDPFYKVGVSIGYTKLMMDEDKFLEEFYNPQDMNVSVSGGDVSILSICGVIRVQTGAMDKAMFFATGGVGLYSITCSDFTVIVNYMGETDAAKASFDRFNKLGGYVNAGVAIPIIADRLNLGLKVQYSGYKVSEDVETFSNIEAYRSFFSLTGVLVVSY